jgi:hypothetical protein
MTMKHTFRLSKDKEDTHLTIHRCNNVGSNDQWFSFILGSSDIDDLKRVLGMGDCDHCDPAWQIKKLEQALIDARKYYGGNIISCDMMRFASSEQLVNVANKVEHIANNATGHIKRLDDRVAYLDAWFDKHGKWLNNLQSSVDLLEGRVDNTVKNTATDMLDLDTRTTKLEERLIELGNKTVDKLDLLETELKALDIGLHTLAKVIDDIRVDLERTKTDMSVMKFAFTTHMGISHGKDK